MARRFFKLLSTTVAVSLPTVYAGLMIAAKSSKPSSSVLCVKDTINVSWAVEDWIGVTAPVWLQVLDSVQDREVTRFDLFQPNVSRVPGDVSGPLEKLPSVIYCLHDGPFKIPDVRTVRYSTVQHSTQYLTV